MAEENENPGAGVTGVVGGTLGLVGGTAGTALIAERIQRGKLSDAAKARLEAETPKDAPKTDAAKTQPAKTSADRLKEQYVGETGAKKYAEEVVGPKAKAFRREAIDKAIKADAELKPLAFLDGATAEDIAQAQETMFTNGREAAIDKAMADARATQGKIILSEPEHQKQLAEAKKTASVSTDHEFSKGNTPQSYHSKLKAEADALTREAVEKHLAENPTHAKFLEPGANHAQLMKEARQTEVDKAFAEAKEAFSKKDPFQYRQEIQQQAKNLGSKLEKAAKDNDVLEAIHKNPNISAQELLDLGARKAGENAMVAKGKHFDATYKPDSYLKKVEAEVEAVKKKVLTEAAKESKEMELFVRHGSKPEELFAAGRHHAVEEAAKAAEKTLSESIITEKGGKALEEALEKAREAAGKSFDTKFAKAEDYIDHLKSRADGVVKEAAAKSEDLALRAHLNGEGHQAVFDAATKNATKAETKVDLGDLKGRTFKEQTAIKVEAETRANFAKSHPKPAGGEELTAWMNKEKTAVEEALGKLSKAEERVFSGAKATRAASWMKPVEAWKALGTGWKVGTIGMGAALGLAVFSMIKNSRENAWQEQIAQQRNAQTAPSPARG